MTKIRVHPPTVPTTAAPFHPKATHVDALGMPVAFTKPNPDWGSPKTVPRVGGSVIAREYVVTTTPNDPSLGVQWVGEARDALHALDQYAVEQGFPPYSELIDPRDNPLHEDERDSLVCQTADGLCWAVMTNYSVCAVPTGDRELAERLVRLCLDFAGAGNDDTEAEMLDAEGAIIERLAISPDETEQGLTRGAVERIEAFVSEQRGRRWSYEDAGLLGLSGADGLR